MADPTPLAITDQIAELIKGAFDSGHVLLLAVVDRDNKPILSFRGSTSVFSPTQLSFWARNADGGTIEALQHNPNIAMMYRSPTVPLLQFIGRARISEDPADRERAFSISHEKEQQRDPERKGRAVIVDLDAIKGVLGRTAEGPIVCNMART